MDATDLLRELGGVARWRALVKVADRVGPHPGRRGRTRRTPGARTLCAVDLADETLWLALEADSFEWHGNRSALASDTRRYNGLVVNGWMVLRFCSEDVMFRPEVVREILVAAVALHRTSPVLPVVTEG